jgi:glycosyltransferase involved in cell wall biosynthesis
VRLLYSFPHALGRPGIGTTAYHQAAGAIRQGLDVTVVCTSLARELPGALRVVETLRVGGRRVPHRALGVRRAYSWHDRRCAGLLDDLAGEIDLVHCWPAGCLATLRRAGELGIPTAREVPNTHTRYAFQAVARESESTGVAQARGHSHTFSAEVLAAEEAEYDAADLLLVPSEFSLATFLANDVPPGKLALHRYGADPGAFFPAEDRAPESGLTAVFVGGCEPRKGLHHALRAWIHSGAAETGRFVIAGEFVPGYAESLGPLLEHPSVDVRGFASDPAAVMRAADVLVLPSVEEGSALVTYEAQLCGCVPVVSDASGARCVHGRTGLVHPAGDVELLTDHLRLLHQNPELLACLRRAVLAERERLTWDAAAAELAEVYAALVSSRVETPAPAALATA